MINTPRAHELKNIDINRWEDFFEQYIKNLESIDLDKLPEYFSLPETLLPRDSDGNFRTFTNDEISDILKAFEQTANKTWIASHQPSKINIIFPHGEHIGLGRSREELSEMGTSYPKLVQHLRELGGFTVYIARDAAPLFEVNTYLTKSTGESEQAGLIYHGGLKILGRKETTANSHFSGILSIVVDELMTEEIDPYRTMSWYEFSTGMREDKTRRMIPKQEHKNLTDNGFFQLYLSKVQERTFSELDANPDSDFYQQSEIYYQQMKNTGMFSSDCDTVRFFDTQGSGKTLVYSKVIFDYFSRKDGVQKKSEVLLGQRYANSVDNGWASVSGFPVLMDTKGYKELFNLEIALKENDMHPFSVIDVDGGSPVLTANSMPIQIRCLFRSMTNWNSSIIHSKMEKTKSKILAPEIKFPKIRERIRRLGL